MSLDSMYSPMWYRVANLKPRLRNHAEVHRHHYRGRLWYVLQDHSSGRYHRLSPAAYYLVAQMDGKRTFQEIWDRAVDFLGDDAPTQDEMIRLAGQLHTSDTLLCDVPPDTLELFGRHRLHEKMKLKQWFWSPLSIRFPLLNPERFLARWQSTARYAFNWLGFTLWLAVVGYAVFLAGVHWGGLTQNLADRVMTPENLFVLWLVYPLVKLVHEFGHAFATKVWGGEVHEMGIMLLVFIPVPYVEASSASAFSEKSKRMIVDAAGIMVELFLAALAMYVWVNVEHGLVHTIAYNVILIGSVSTLLFNGNPLLRFDGYYFLSDAIEIPNLGTRSTQYLGYLFQRYLFGAKHVKSPANSWGERSWLLFYGIASFFYRLFIMGVIVLFVAGKFFIIGMVLAMWALMTMLVIPIYKKLDFLARSPVISGKRVRAVVLSAVLVLSLGWFIFKVPFPYATRAEGVIWPPEKSILRAQTHGFIQEVQINTNQHVKRDDAIMISEDPLLIAEKKVLQKELKELEVRYMALRFENRTQAEIKKEEMLAVRAQLERMEEKESQLVIRSPLDGTLILPNSDDLKDRFVNKGQLLGYVVDYPLRTVRVVVPQDRIGLVKEQTRGVQVRMAERISEVYAAQVKREVPAATENLPSMALGLPGGGEVAVDPSDEAGTKAFKSVFQLDLELPAKAGLKSIGERVFVRFDHGKVPLAEQWYRMVRQLLLKRFGV
ncbi:Peptidase, M50 family [Nitrospina gracilis 3/211]|uniref:Peptidase, M50 family n=1 Tax=Nitrospina gracilis (strain 3/211) TaxID=1266370 RepID=M1YYY2_NITG3|nr:Peptidase, M50 family [Nitrospina gracilis 3/211]